MFYNGIAHFTTFYLYTLTFVVFYRLLVLFLVWKSNDAKDIFSFYVFIMNNKVHGCMVYTERAEIDSLWQQILVAPAMPAL